MRLVSSSSAIHCTSQNSGDFVPQTVSLRIASTILIDNRINERLTQIENRLNSLETQMENRFGPVHAELH